MWVGNKENKQRKQRKTGTRLKLKAILFDMDDTLIDWGERSQDWVSYEREHLAYVVEHVTNNGHAVHDVESFYHSVRAIATQSWTDAALHLRAPKYAESIEQGLARVGVPPGSFDHDTLLEAFRWDMVDGVRVFPDVREVLPALCTHGLALGVITNAATPMRLRDRELAAVGLLDYFSPVRLSAVDVGWIKPHPAIFEHALNQLGLKAEEVVFVGDNPEADIAGAKNVGMKAVLRIIERDGVVYKQTVPPDASVKTFHELLPILDAWYPGWRS
jgi:putative hydrolase of the HAD superfamily